MRRRFHIQPRILAVAAATALLFSASAAASDDTYKLRQTPAGKAAAKAVVPTKSDLGSATDWSGGPVKADITGSGKCANYKPKRSDLLLSGAAATSYKNAGVTVRGDSQVFASARMAALDWQRTVKAPQFLSCLREQAKTAWKAPNRFVSLDPIRLPHMASSEAGFRMVLDVTRNGQTVRVVLDRIGMLQGATELGISTIMAQESAPDLFPNELVLARTLVRRVRA